MLGRFTRREEYLFIYLSTEKAFTRQAQAKEIRTKELQKLLGWTNRPEEDHGTASTSATGVGAREGACQALGLMHPACLALTTVRDGGNENYLPPRRPGDAVPGETVCPSRQGHSRRLQKCHQETQLQIFLQIDG